MNLYVGLISGWFVAGIVLISGCANPASPVSSISQGRTDIVTESDESDLRRRAKLRLELAAGYFEQGQTNVALDEIKQSLMLDPTFADAYNMRGVIYMRLNNAPLAEDSFRRALAVNARDPDVSHNYGYFLCQQARYEESFKLFNQAISNPVYGGKAKSLRTLGVCQLNAKQFADAEKSLTQSYELDAGNPVTAYNLANLLYERNDLVRAQFYIRRLNNGELANAETLWLGAKTERKMNNIAAVKQLGEQLRKRFPQSPQAALYEKGAFNE
jgi:type IV pilus assembly protein PilF